MSIQEDDGSPVCTGCDQYVDDPTYTYCPSCGAQGRRKPNIKDRLRRALRQRGGSGQYHDVMREVFPDDQYPRAWRRSSNGGPPGCAMAFGRAIREMGVYDNFKLGSGRFLTLVERLP